MKLKGRLRCIAEMVPHCGLVADIGTDHAYVPLYLVKNGICRNALACDVRSGPVEAAENNIRKYGLEDKIQTRLGDGLAPVKNGEADIIVIAGMGGLLITEILTREMDKAREAECLILQPMNAIEVVREWLCSNGFFTDDEELVAEGSKIYVVMRVHWTGSVEKQQPIYYYIGKRLVEKRHPLLGRIICKRLNELNNALSELTKAGSGGDDIKDHYIWLKQEYEKIQSCVIKEGDL